MGDQRDIEESDYIAARQKYEEDCFNWKLSNGEFPKPPSISPPLEYRIASKFDDKYYYGCAIENYKDCYRYTERNDGSKGYLNTPTRPLQLAGKPPKVPKPPKEVKPLGRPKLYAWTLEMGFTTEQTRWLMNTAADAQVMPADVVRAVVDEMITKEKSE